MCGFFSSPTTNSLTPWTLTGCPMIQFNSDELLGISIKLHKLKVQSHRIAPTSDTTTSPTSPIAPMDQLNIGVPWASLQVQ